MAATVTHVTSPMRRQTRGEFMGFHGVLVDVTGDAAYDDDGYVITAASLGLRSIVGAFVAKNWHESTNETVYPVEFAYATGGVSIAVQALQGAAAVSDPMADAAADNLSTFTCRIFVFGN